MMKTNAPPIPANTAQAKGDEIDLRKWVLNLVNYWHYYAIALVVVVALAIAYLKITTPRYEASSSLLIKSDQQNSNQLQDFIDGDIFGNKKNLTTEIGILQSKSVLLETIQQLQLQTTISRNHTFGTALCYHDASISVQQITAPVIDQELSLQFTDPSHFTLQGSTATGETMGPATYASGDTIRTPACSLVVVAHQPTTEVAYTLHSHSPATLIADYSQRLTVASLNKDANIINLNFKDANPQLAVDFLNTISQIYIDRDIRNKSAVAALTLHFIEAQLSELSKTLGGIEQTLQRYKEQKGTVNLSEESKSILEKLNAIDIERAKAELDLKTLSNLYDYIKSEKSIAELAPSSIGIPDPVMIDLLSRIRTLEAKRRELDIGLNKDAPQVKISEQQLNDLRLSLLENIATGRDNARTRLQGLMMQLRTHEALIKKIPLIERELLGIQRNFEVNENIYLYLLQKKAETGIAKAAAVSDNKILDPAITSHHPVEPNKKMIILLALLAGLFIPTLLISVKSFLSNTISHREEVEQLSPVPVAGVIGHVKSDSRLVVAAQPKSAIAEAFRSIRANLMFMGLAQKNKIILITSSVGGEGKSFCSLNLASVLALQGHSVVLVGLDLRKPQLYRELEVPNHHGISNYLSHQATLESIITPTKHQHLHFISSGPVPPNPAELLSQPAATALLQLLRQRYDYVVIDTPPVGIVADAMSLMGEADIALFILRERYSKKEYLKMINQYYHQGVARQMCLLLNDAGLHKTYGYGYGGQYYGYGYYDEEQPPQHTQAAAANKN